MASDQQPDTGRARPWIATARALKIMVAVGKRDVVEHGAVDPRTWESIDALLDELIEQLPDPPRPARARG